jgi:hypothetical protein
MGLRLLIWWTLLRNLHSDEAPAPARKNMRLLAVPAPYHYLNQCYGAGAASFSRSRSRNAMRSRKEPHHFGGLGARAETR